MEDRRCAGGEDEENSVMPVWLRRLFGRGELRHGLCYPEMRAAAERVCGDLSLRGERRKKSVKVSGCPFDEYEYEQLRMRTGHA